VGFVLLIDRRGGLYRHLMPSDSTIDQPERGCTVGRERRAETERAASEMLPGSKFHALLRSADAAFEIDGIDEGSRTGWSVIMRG